jgi:hypothetical protein
MGPSTIKVNRAPVLTLWAAVVAERLGYDWQEALTLGRAVAGLNAQSKGQRLGIYNPPTDEERAEQRKRQPDEQFRINLMGRAVPAISTPEGIRALDKDRPANPASVERYLKTRFGEAYPEALEAMRALAQTYPDEELAREAYRLYERFRPAIPEGKKGWGAQGELDLQGLQKLGKPD